MNAAVRGENSGGRVYFVTFSRRAWQAVLLALAVGFLALAAWWQQRPEGEAPPGPAATDAVAPLADADVLAVPAAASGPAADDSAAVSLTPAPPAAAEGPASAPPRSHPFDDLRLERERLRSRQAELLQAAALDPAVGEARRREAHEELLALWELEARELEIEQLLRAHGYDAVAVLSPAGAHVVVDAVLDQAAAALIGELTHRIAGVKRETVTIVDGVSSGR